jgi:probable HAF family extracellular repeat protein
MVKFAFFLLAPVYLAAQAPQFTIQDLGTLPNLPSCNATALSQGGNVVGYCTSAAGQNLLLNTPATHVFLYSKGTMTDLNITAPSTAFPTGVNDSGTVVGGALTVNLLSETASVFL